jgi:ABC-type phosphate transport system permease subunit
VAENSSESSKLNVETDVHLTKKKRIVFWVYLIAIFIFVLLTTFLILYSWTPFQQFKTTDQYYFANQVANEWKKGTNSLKLGFINDILVTANATCPDGY